MRTVLKHVISSSVRPEEIIEQRKDIARWTWTRLGFEVRQLHPLNRNLKLCNTNRKAPLVFCSDTTKQLFLSSCF